MKRKLLSVLLALCMLLALMATPIAAAYQDTEGHWAESSIERWTGHGIVQGTENGFDPDGELTCAHLAAILARLLKLPEAPDAGFSDNPAEAWYYDSVNRCAAAGILLGNGDGTVTPNAPITRERAIVMLSRALGIEPIKNPDLSAFEDADAVADYAQGYVAALVAAGVIKGVTDETVGPQLNITRAATVAILDRAIAVYADTDGAEIDASEGGFILVAAENVAIKNAPAGTKVLVTPSADGLTVNGKKVESDQTYVVPENKPVTPTVPTHSHSYDTSKWVVDDTYHWHAANCGHDLTIDKAEHSFGDDGICTVCGQLNSSMAVAQINGQNYAALAAAIAAAAAGDTVTLVGDVIEDVTVSAGKTVTIDLGGKKLTNVSSDTIIVENGATLTITGTGTVDNVTHGKAAIYNNGTVTLNGGSYTRSEEKGEDKNNSGGNSYYNILNHGIMTIEETVSVTSSGHFSSLIASGYYNFSDTANPRNGYVSGTNHESPSLTINGGTFSGGINTIKNDDNAQLIINGGSFSNVTQAVVQNNHVAEIHGGSFNADGNHVIENRHYDGGHNAGSVTVTSGTFTGGLYTTTGATWSITGGTFSSDPSAYVAAGYEATEDNGTWTVGEKTGVTLVAQVGLNKYESLADALAAAKDGDTVKLVDDVTLDSLLRIEKNITLDLGGKTLRREGSVLDIYSTVTIQNGTIGTTSTGSTSAVWVNGAAKLTVASDVTFTTTENAFALAFDSSCTAAEVIFRGTITGGNGITMNGLIAESAANILTMDGATINVTGHGIYQAGCANTAFTIENSTISGATGIEVRAGVLNVTNSVISGSGEFNSVANAGGTTTDGAGIAVVQHTTNLPINVTISGGEISGTYAFYQATKQSQNTAESIAKITLSVTGGEFNGTVYSENKTGFITGGRFSSKPDNSYIAAGYEATENNDGTWTVA